VLGFEWTKPDELCVRFRMRPGWKTPGSPEAAVFFLGVKNRAELDEQLGGIEPTLETGLRCIAGLLEAGRGDYRLGPLRILCAGTFEP
jgi:hypothetical protein